jgi:hypothetical protein
VTEGVFSACSDDGAEFHRAVDLGAEDLEAVQGKMKHRGLRWLHRHGHLDDESFRRDPASSGAGRPRDGPG